MVFSNGIGKILLIFWININILGATTAGLTLGFIRDGPSWAVEAGSLVLAD